MYNYLQNTFLVRFLIISQESDNFLAPCTPVACARPYLAIERVGRDVVNLAGSTIEYGW